MIIKRVFSTTGIHQNRKSKVVVFWLIIWCVYHFITLKISPMPWMDEIVFADISNAFHETGKFILPLSLDPYNLENEYLIYGPVFFIFQSFFIFLFGLNEISIRLISLFPGIFIISLFCWALRKESISWAYIGTFFCLMSVDIIFQSNMHSGRPDLLSICFFFAGLFIHRYKVRPKLSVISGCLFALAFLTTPRIGIYLVTLPVLFIFDLIKNRTTFVKIIEQYVIMLLFFLLPIGIWLIIKFDGIANYIEYMTNHEIIQTHQGKSIIPNKHQLPALFTCLMLFFTACYQKKGSLWNLYLILLASCHLFFIIEKGPYSATLMPVIYFLIILNFSAGKKKIYFLIPLLFILVLNASVFLLKSTTLLASRDSRNPTSVSKFLDKYELNNKVILADYKFYYLIKSHGGIFKSYGSNKPDIIQENLNEIDYLILSEKSFEKLKIKLNKSEYVITSYSYKSKSALITFLTKYNIKFDNNYNCIILELNKKK